MALEVQDFHEEVIEASHHTPVLVDFWAPWCGPCRVLGPVLDKLAAENGGDWKLVKVNTDVNQEVSVQYSIRGIPAVKLFVDGKVVDEFTGALPEYAVKQWLEKALPSENRQLVDQAETALQEGDEGGAERLLRQVLDTEPENPKARVLLAQIVVFRDPTEAAELVKGSAFAGPGFVQIEDAVQTIARLMSFGTGELPEGEGRDEYGEAISALTTRDFDAAVERFIEVIRKNRYYDDDGARKACVALFTLLGPEHPVTRKHRRVFDMALY